ncbi:MAG: hypothetical protein H7Y01_05635 [Ferruginibacter sp.]|nr:hypothetical protein [Chitinophagaceae bacterium]
MGLTRKIICCLTILVFYLPGSFGQNLSSLDTNKYRINLPDYWGRGNKIWQVLLDKLPLVCEELKDKELCGDDCNPKYFIEFEMSAPVIYDYSSRHILSDNTNNFYKRPSGTWDITTLYGFECSLLLLDNNNKLLTRLIVVDTDETWTFSNRITLPSYSPPPPLYPAMRWVSTGQEGQSVYSYINKNKEKLAPAFKDMFAVVDKKIGSW